MIALDCSKVREPVDCPPMTPSTCERHWFVSQPYSAPPSRRRSSSAKTTFDDDVARRSNSNDERTDDE